MLLRIVVLIIFVQQDGLQMLESNFLKVPQEQAGLELDD